MKATGIVRRIDDLGRVVIPKEIRRTMRIREGDPLEIFTNTDGQIIFKKYSAMMEFSEFTSQYAEVLNKALSMPVIITDRDHVVAFSGIAKKEVYEKNISKQLESVMESRSAFVASEANKTELYPIDSTEIRASIAYPVISNGDVTGSVLALFGSSEAFASSAEIKLCQVASQFLGKQTEE